VVDADGRIPLHYAATGSSELETLQQLLRLYPEGIHVVDRNGMLPLHMSCFSPNPRLDHVHLLVEADIYTVVQKTQDGNTAFKFAWRMQRTHRQVELYLAEKAIEAVSALTEAFEGAANMELGLDVAHIWSFAQPNLWRPEEEKVW
jgi:ankyrin repeat protein